MKRLGTIRDVIAESSLPGPAQLTMEPPVRTDSESIRDEKVQVLPWNDPDIEPKDLVRGQFRGYRQPTDVSAISQTETFAAFKLRNRFLAVAGVPFYHPCREVFAGDQHRDRGSISQNHRRCIKGFDLQSNLFSVTDQSRVAFAVGLDGDRRLRHE